jgi:hypothetical protein
MAPLQKRAWWGLGVGLAFGIASALVFILMGGISAFDEDAGFRAVIDVLWIGGLIANLVIINLTLRKKDMVDERDRLVMDRAPRVQWLAVIFTLVAWTIALPEVYHTTRLVPSVYLYVVFMSVLIAGTIAYSLGIIIGYRRLDR